MSQSFLSRVTCHTFTVYERDERLRAEIEVQAIHQKGGGELWAVFAGGGGVWTRERVGFVPRSTVNLFERNPRALWSEQEAKAEAQIAAALILARDAARLAAYDLERATSESKYLIVDTTEESASGMIYFRRSDNGLTTILAGAKRFTAAELPKAGEPTGFGVLLNTVCTLAASNNGQVDQKYLAALMIRDGAAS